MITFSSDDLVTFANQLEGRKLRTLHEGAEFTAEVHGDHIIYTPSKTMKPRPHDKQTLQRICDKFSKTNSLSPSHYDDQVTRNASYTLTLIVKYLAAKADATL